MDAESRMSRVRITLGFIKDSADSYDSLSLEYNVAHMHGSKVRKVCTCNRFYSCLIGDTMK